MPAYRIQHAWQGFGGGSTDLYVNDFYVTHPTLFINDPNPSFPAEPCSVAIFNAIRRFYNNDDSTGTRPIEYMSPRIAGDGRKVAAYKISPDDTDIDISASGTPEATEVTVAFPSGLVAPPDVQSLPEEVAVCLSYKATSITLNEPRHRGRIYIGPLNIAAMDDVISTNAPVIVREPFLNSLMASAQTMKAELAAFGWVWKMVSRANAQAYEITEVSADNNFDTIRGRGNTSGVRVALAL